MLLQDVLLKRAPEAALQRGFSVREIMPTLDLIDHARLAAAFSTDEIDTPTPELASRLRALAAEFDFSLGLITDEPVPVPQSASKLGLMRALREIDLWETAKAAVASDPDVQEQWDLAIEIKRSDPLTAGIVATLALTDQQVDQLLIRAAELVA